MASSSSTGVSSGKKQLLKQVKNSDESKLKRMVSNRESAKRSRLRKQKHLVELMTQISQLKSKNHVMRTNMSVTNQMHVTIEADNSVLKAQLAELSQRLESLNHIIGCINTNKDVTATNDVDAQMIDEHNDLLDLWDVVVQFGQPIDASADMFM